MDKLFCLFPFFVQWPFLFHRPRVRKRLLAAPRMMLRLAYELIYTYKMSRLCIPRTPLRIKLRMVLRHLRNL